MTRGLNPGVRDAPESFPLAFDFRTRLFRPDLPPSPRPVIQTAGSLCAVRQISSPPVVPVPPAAFLPHPRDNRLFCPTTVPFPARVSPPVLAGHPRRPWCGRPSQSITFARRSATHRSPARQGRVLRGPYHARHYISPLPCSSPLQGAPPEGTHPSSPWGKG